MAKHLRSEQLEQFKDAVLANDVVMLGRFQAHVDTCEQCRTRIVETRVVEARLRDAFVRVRVDRTVTEDDVQRARANWIRGTTAVLLPVPDASARRTSLSVRPLPVQAGDVGFIKTWSERWLVAPRITLGVVALAFAMLIGLAAGDAFHSWKSSRAPVALAPTGESRPPASIVAPQSPAPTLFVVRRNGKMLSSSSTTAAPLRNAAARSQNVEAGVTGDHRREGSDGTLRVNRDLLGRLLHIQPPYEFVQRVAVELPPPLRLDFYVCVADPAAEQRSCVQTLGRAQSLMARRGGRTMRGLTDSADAPAWQRIQDRLYLR
jgi:hypothetical protein